MFDKVHHVAYLVGDMDRAAKLITETFGMTMRRRFISPNGTEFAFFNLGDSGTTFELIVPGPTSTHDPVGPEVLELDHVAYAVHNLDDVIAQLRRSGVQFETPEPYIAQTSWRVIRTDGTSTMGRKIQLVDADHK
jgi:catechol 2,3-dioxygenase-like lactoylglutathione lyase family enzyme